MSVYNGWTPTIPLKTRLENLLAQVPQEHRNRAAAECACDNPHDFERYLTAYVWAKKWLLKSVGQPHPAETAYALEQAMDAEVMDEISAAAREDSEWREGWNGFCGELRGHVGADDPRTEWERDWDDYCAEVEKTNRDLGEWARGR